LGLLTFTTKAGLSRHNLREYKMNTETKNGAIITYHENGKKHTEENWVNGKQEGLFTAWHKNGKR